MGKKRRRKKRRHPQRFTPRSRSLDEILDEARALAEEGNFEEALEILEDLPPHLQRRLEVLMLRGIFLIEIGALLGAAEVFEQALRAAPNHPLVLTYLTFLYADLDWLAHAARFARRALEAHEGLLPAEMVRDLREILKETVTEIQEMAAEKEVSPAKVEEALYIGEQAERRMLHGRFGEAARLYDRASRVLPAWTNLRNNTAIALFLTGRVKQAVQIGESVLETHPEDVYALANLVRFHLALDERDKAEAYGERLKRLRIDSADELDKAIEALGFLGDDEALYEIYRGHRRRIDDLSPFALFSLGAAAANLGHFRTAQRLWKKAGDAELLGGFLPPYFTAARRKAPGPGYADRYPTVSFPQMVHPSHIAELIDLVRAWNEGNLSERQRERRTRKIVKRSPFLVRAFAQMLWEAPDPVAAIDVLSFIKTPEAIEELRRFAFSQAGSMQDRLAALEALADLGAIDREKPVQVWDEKRQHWIDASMFAVEITTETEPPDYDEAVWEHINAGVEAFNRGALEEACEELEAALKLDPRAAIAHHNLAVILQEMGRIDEGVEHLKKALEIRPDYPFARCSLANFYIDEGDLEAAEDLLSPLAERRRFHPDEWAYYHRTIARLRLEQEDYEAAEQHAQIVLEIIPDDEVAQQILEAAQFGGLFTGSYWEEFLRRQREREERKRRRPTRADATLAECLERITKDGLVGTARAMPTPRKYNVRKAILIQDLVEYLSNPEVLREIVKRLSEEERQALRDVLEAGGTMDWEKFTGRYGDDLDESPYWDYHEPETVMGRLRMLGLLSEGTVDDRLIVLIPYELRELLPPLLEEKR